MRKKLANGWRSAGWSSVSAELERHELSRREAFLVEVRLGGDWLNSICGEKVSSLKAALIDGEVGLEFVRYENSAAESCYSVFAVYPEPGLEVAFVDLGLAREVDMSIEEWQELIQLGGDPNPEIDCIRTLQDRIVKPVLHLIAGREKVLASMDGRLLQLPLDAFFNEAGSRLLRTYDISYVPSLSQSIGRVVHPVDKTRERSSTVIAAPDFGTRQSITGKRTSGDLFFEHLPHAEEEGRRVAALLGANLFVGQHATVESLIAVKSPAVLHIATHAFALEYHPTSGVGAMSDQVPLLKSVSDPMVRAGLALAMANIDDQRTERQVKGDGLFTALQVATLDLRGTRLVVLSACDTGRGQLHRGEGVQGLRGAFMIAGAQAVIATLWRVPDLESCNWMTSMYEMLCRGATIQDAIRAAKVRLLDEGAAPLYWAGFVCYGAGTQTIH